jgi:hypothetical protein
MTPSHPWKARILVGIIMLVLAFIGMVVTGVYSRGGWQYWRFVIPVYAILALWLSWYLKRQLQTISPITIWHEVCHWLGLLCAIFLVSHLSNMGILSHFIAGIFHLILLSLALFIAGIYIEVSFVLIGIVLGFFAYISAALVEYMYSFVIPISLGAIAITGVTIWISHKRFKKTQDE